MANGRRNVASCHWMLVVTVVFLPMWYFTWVLGLGLAVAFGILNAMWHEFHLVDCGDDGSDEE